MLAEARNLSVGPVRDSYAVHLSRRPVRGRTLLNRTTKESMSDNRELNAVKKAISLDISWVRDGAYTSRFNTSVGPTDLYLSVTNSYAQLTISSRESDKKTVNIYRNLAQTKDVVLLELIKLKNHLEEKEKERDTALDEFLRYVEPRSYSAPPTIPKENVVTISNEDMRDQGRLE